MFMFIPFDDESFYITITLHMSTGHLSHRYVFLRATPFESKLRTTRKSIYGVLEATIVSSIYRSYLSFHVFRGLLHEERPPRQAYPGLIDRERRYVGISTCSSGTRILYQVKRGPPALSSNEQHDLAWGICPFRSGNLGY